MLAIAIAGTLTLFTLTAMTTQWPDLPRRGTSLAVDFREEFADVAP
jgi:hypothetical protein